MIAPRHAPLMKGLVTMGTAALLSACVPAPLGRYYKPLYPEPAATYAGDLCYGQAGAPAVLTVPLADGVSFTVRATDRGGSAADHGRTLALTVRVPPGVHFRFLGERIGVEPVDPSSAPAAPQTMMVNAQLVLPARETVDPAHQAPTPLTTPQGTPLYRDYQASTGWNAAWGDGFRPQAFTMTLPTFVRPGQPDLPIEVEAQARQRPERYPGENKRNTSLIYVTAGSEARTQARYLQCLAEGRPPKNCEAIHIYDDGGFQLTRNDVEIGGRWYVFDVERGDPLRADLYLRTQSAAPWRLAGDQIVIRSPSEPHEKRHTFTQLDLSMRYTVPLATPVYLPTERADRQRHPVALSTERALGHQEAARYRVELPAVEINGRTYPLQPIELERHSLDFGLLPFNC